LGQLKKSLIASRYRAHRGGWPSTTSHASFGCIAGSQTVLALPLITQSYVANIPGSGKERKKKKNEARKESKRKKRKARKELSW